MPSTSLPSNHSNLPSTNIDTITGILRKRESVRHSLQTIYQKIKDTQESLTPILNALAKTISAVEDQEVEKLNDIKDFLKAHPLKAQEPPATSLLEFYKDVFSERSGELTSSDRRFRILCYQTL